jgi:hypothetical protein
MSAQIAHRINESKEGMGGTQNSDVRSHVGDSVPRSLPLPATISRGPKSVRDRIVKHAEKDPRERHHDDTLAKVKFRTYNVEAQ